MNKILLFILVLLSFNQLLNAQCTPVPFTGNVISPDSTQGVSPVVATYPYSQVISVRIPSDTIIPPVIFPIPIDSAGIINVTGLPPGLSWTTNSANHFWPKNSYGCILIQGTVAQSDIGNYAPKVNGVVYSLGNAFSFTYNYKVVVLDSIYYNVNISKSNGFSLQQNVPNPVLNSTQIKFLSPKSLSYNFEVFDMLGNRVYSSVVQASTGLNVINFNRGTLVSGIYFYKVSNGEYTAVRRLIIK